METGNQAEYAAMQATLAAQGSAADEGVQPARPGKEQVRRWLAGRVASRLPLPEPDAIRRAVGWCAEAGQPATTPETPAAA